MPENIHFRRFNSVFAFMLFHRWWWRRRRRQPPPTSSSTANKNRNIIWVYSIPLRNDGLRIFSASHYQQERKGKRHTEQERLIFNFTGTGKTIETTNFPNGINWMSDRFFKAFASYVVFSPLGFFETIIKHIQNGHHATFTHTHTQPRTRQCFEWSVYGILFSPKK